VLQKHGLEQWLLTAGTLPQEAINKFPEGAISYALYNMESFWMESVPSNLLTQSQEAWNKEQLLQGGMVEKRLRITD